MNEAWPRVGTGVWIRKDGKILFGFRTWKHGPNTWAPPGGKVELYENPEVCARRETLEETGIEIDNLTFAGWTSDVYQEVGKHYVTLHFFADWKSGEAQLKEPDKFASWQWFAWDQLPKPLLLSSQNFVDLNIDPFA